MTNRDTPRKPAPALPLGAEVEVVFTDLLANGQAVGRANGMVVFCFGPLPEERARVRITSSKPKYAVGEMLKLLTGSPFRVQPFCSVFGSCGGCHIQHLSYPAQLSWKTDVVRNALQRIGGFASVSVNDMVGMVVPRAYRNKMSLVIDHHYTTPTIGFYQQRSHAIVPIETCPVVTPQLGECIVRLNAARTQPQTAPALQDARHVVVRSASATGEAVVTVTTNQSSENVTKAGTALLAQLPGAVGLTNSFDLTSQNAIVGRRHRLIAGRADIEEVIAGVRYRVSAGSFFQVNVEIVGRIFAFMYNALSHAKSVVDLYCGAGTFALYFAKHGCRVYGIEENPSAVAEANANATLNGVEEQVRFRTGRVEEAVRSAEARAALAEADLVFLDPPRKGSDETTLGAVVSAGVPYIWYLSCDPATLARDLKFLAANGYRLGIVQPFDMFPQTGHVETLVTLYRESYVADRRVQDAFVGVPPPSWPVAEEHSTAPREYPEFVDRED